MKINEIAKLIEKLLDNVSTAFCDGYLSQNKRIEKFYSVVRHYNDFVIREYPVTEYTCNRPRITLERISQKTLDEHIKKALSWKPTVEDIRIHYKYTKTHKDGSGSTISGCYSLKDFGSRLKLTKEELIETREELRETYLSKDGHSPCAYCNRQRPTETMYEGTIFSPNWRATGGESPLRKYCNGTCHCHDQMAHEG